MKKAYLVLAALASLSVFSSVSTSQGYYARFTQIIPPQVCEAHSSKDALGLRWNPDGLVNSRPAAFSAHPIPVSCPLPRSSMRGEREVYDVAVNFRSLGSSPAQVTCRLVEVWSSGPVIQILERPFTIPAGGSTRLEYQRVPIRSPANQGSLVLSCDLPPEVSLGNLELITFRRDG